MNVNDLYLNKKRIFNYKLYLNWIIIYPYAHTTINFLLKKLNLSLNDLENKRNYFEKEFSYNFSELITILTFSVIIEAKTYLIDKIIKKQDSKKNIVIELASGFTPRWLNLTNKYNIKYIETDTNPIIKLKNEFYDYLYSVDKKIPDLITIDILKKEDFKILYNHINILKLKDPQINNITLLTEWLLVYLNKSQQKIFFENLKVFSKLLKEISIQVKYITTDMPTHENFTNWLVSEDFTLKDHLDVMSKVEPKIIESLHNTEDDFLTSNSIWKIKKHYYSDEIIISLKTPKLAKYKKIPKLKEKIHSFLKQDILFAWEVEL